MNEQRENLLGPEVLGRTVGLLVNVKRLRTCGLPMLGTQAGLLGMGPHGDLSPRRTKRLLRGLALLLTV